MQNAKDYARLLGTLEGLAFEEGVCDFLGHCYLDFQPIPAKPSGDGGIDGLSHRCTRAYCCYGPEQEPFKTNTRGLRADIQDKFRKDLRRILELEQRGRNKLIQVENLQLAGILPPRAKIQAIYLVVSVFNDNRLVGSLNASFADYLEASACRYVASDASLTIWGPAQVVSQGAVTDGILRHIEQEVFLAKATALIDGNTAEQHQDSEDFTAKFSWLADRFPEKIEKLRKLQEELRRHWTIAVRLDQELANTAVSIHQSLQRLREDTTLDAALKSETASSPFELLDGMRFQISRKLKERFENELAADLVTALSNGETARLIGECPIDWRG